MMEHHLRVFACIHLMFVLAWYECLWRKFKFFLHNCAPKIFIQILDFKFQIKNIFFGILEPFTQAIKFLEDSKTADLLFLLQPNYKRFFSDSSSKMILEICSSFSKNFVIFWAQEHLHFEFWTSTIFSSPRAHLSSPPSAFTTPPRSPIGQQGWRRPH